MKNDYQEADSHIAPDDSPKLLCLKQISTLGDPSILMKMDLKIKGQKYRIPFQNLSLASIQVEFSLDKSRCNNIFTVNGNYYECQFIFFPRILQIPSQATCNIDIIAKISKYQIDENFDISKVSSQISKVVNATIKNKKSVTVYSYTLKANVM